MPRPAKPWKHQGWYVTNSLGKPREKLCPIKEGFRRAREILTARQGERDGTVKRLVALPGELLPGKSVEDVYGEYIVFVEVENDEATARFYRDKLKPFIERFARRPMASLTIEDGLIYKKYLLKEKPTRKGYGLSGRTVNHHIRAAKIFFNWAKKPSRQYIKLNPFDELSYCTEKARERVLSDDEFTALLEQCTDGNTVGGAEDFREQLKVLRGTTLRPGELRALRWEYIRWADHQIVFPAGKIKTRSRRVVTMTDAVEDILRDRQNRLGHSSGFVFTTPGLFRGKRTAGRGTAPLKANGLAQRFRRLVERCVKAKLIDKEIDGEKITPYHTRRTRISELVRLDLPFRVVMGEAGHVNPSTTEVYVSQVQNHITRSVRGLAGGSREES